jgi:RNase P protein component
VARNTLRRRLREATREVAGALPRGIYLVRLEPAAASTDPAELSTFVQQALSRAGQAGGGA